MVEHKWSWWVGHDDERFHTECGSREEAVRIAQDKCEGAYIVEASKPVTLNLSEYFDADRFIEDADERAWEDHGDHEGDDPVFDVSGEQLADLERQVREAIDAWQKRHGLKFTGYRFSAARNGEFIPAAEEESQ